MTETEAVQEAWRLYHTDPMFHAHVEHAVGVAATDRNGERMAWNENGRAIARLAAAVALVVSKLNPTTGEPL